jgi:hypothetical protein
MKVYLNDKDNKRKIVNAELIKKREHSSLVKLPDGNIIVRRNKDIIKEE